MSCASIPAARSVTTTSSATGRSLVPAVTTATRAARRSNGSRHNRQPPSSTTCGSTARHASRCDSEARVNNTGPVPFVQQFAENPGALFGRLARPVDRLGHALAEVAMMIDGGALDIGERQAAQTGDRLVGVDRSRPDVVDELPHRHLVHGIIVPCDRAVDVA